MLIRPVIGPGPGQEDHGFCKRQADLEHRSILSRKVRQERGNVAGAQVWIEQQSTQRDGRHLLGQGGTSKQGAGKVVGDRIGDRPADHVHLADELEACF